MNPWSRARRSLAVLAFSAAVLTGLGAGTLGGGLGHALGAAAYVVVAAIAVFSPTAIAIQVVAGQALAAGVLLGPTDAGFVAVLPLVVGVVVTAEMLGAVARLGITPGRDPRTGLRRSGLAGFLGGATFGLVALLIGLEGPGGLTGLALAGGGCVLLAALLIRNARRGPTGHDALPDNAHTPSRSSRDRGGA